MAQDPRPKLKDVASEAGVSPTTASLILNGQADSFATATVDRVRERAAALGYRPNHLARSLRQKRTHTIGIISDSIATTPFAGAMIRGAQEAAWKAGHVLVLIDSDRDPELELAGIRALADRAVDGLLYARMKHDVVQVPDFPPGTNVVLLNARSDDHRWSSVAPDEAGGAAAAVDHLVANGHTRIGYVQNPDPVPAPQERLAGFVAALERHEIRHDDKLVVIDPDEGRGSFDAVEELLVRPDRPTALFCFNDRTAAGVYNAARRLGIRIPDDLSIVGFDNMETVVLWLDPKLTTVQLPHYEMGRWAVEKLETMIAGAQVPPEQVRMPCPLVERASVHPFVDQDSPDDRAPLDKQGERK